MTVIGMTPSAAAAVVETVRRELMRHTNTLAARPVPYFSGGTPKWIAKTGASTIAARSGTTVTSGTVTLQKIVDGELSAHQNNGTDITVDAYNLFSAEIAANAYILIAREVASGKYFVISEDCP